ncbi:MAG: hypothetical protein QGH45_11020, partial [Myxococcota bacterium]|nr:hypothetical protein [Myxococcota bacterium]
DGDDADCSGDDDTADDDDTTPGDAFDLLPLCDVLAELDPDTFDPPGADSGGYSPPPGFVRDGVAASITALLDGQGEDALGAVEGTSYELCRGGGDESEVALWRPDEPGTGRALVAWRRGPARPLIVGAPHGSLELVTLEQAVTAFERLQTRALIVSATHRCANAGATDCDGTTPACGDEEEPFRESDMAHVVESVFQAAHETLAAAHPDHWVLSLHGMDLSGISLSDGTTFDSALGTPVAILGAALMDAFPSEWVTSCNAWPGAVVEERLCGTFNVQGRMVNGSVDPCAANASLSAGRFVHVEQSATVREFPDLLIGALDDALPAAR